MSLIIEGLSRPLMPSVRCLTNELQKIQIQNSVGMIVTIAEGPNPFGFLVPRSYPAFCLLDALSFLPVPNVDGWSLVLLGLLVNLLLYFLLGYLMDYTVSRFWNR
jgi:hypothetical protein